MPTDQSCSNCLAFEPDPDGSSIGFCRAHPPRVVVDSALAVTPATVWPEVAGNDWCGEWQAAPVVEEPQPIEPEPEVEPEEPDEEDEPVARSSHTRKKRR